MKSAYQQMAEGGMHVRQVITVLRDRLASILGFTAGGKRDLYDNFGWHKQLLVEQLFAQYYRNGLANRICRIYPAATWRNPPTFRDEDGSSAEPEAADYSPFVESVWNCLKKYGVIGYLERADRVSGVGRFSLLLMGFRDGKELEEPLTQGKFPITFMAVYADPNVTIAEWDRDVQSPRYGKPTYYTVQTGNPVVGGGQVNVMNRSHRVHWSRVLHLAEFLDEDEVYSIPRLVPVYNEVQDLEKLMGSGAETYWLNSRGGMVWSADKEANFSTSDIERMERQAEEFANQLRRITALQGVTPTLLQAQITDPANLIDKQLDIISGATGIPKRILIGSERGELSSEQDENNWAQRVEERRLNYAAPKILKPVVSKLILTQNVVPPNGEWEVQWPGAGLGPQKAAEVGAIRSNTLRSYVMSPGAPLIVPREEFRKEFLGLDPVSEYDDEVTDEQFDEALLAGADPKEGDGDDPAEDGKDADLDRKRDASIRAQIAGGSDGPRLELSLRELKAFSSSEFGRDFLKTHSLCRTLYVRRPVLNAADILMWARKQGFTTLLSPDDLHVTLAYSDTAVDWFAVPNPWNENDEGELLVKPGGARTVETLGDHGAVVLRFRSEMLETRHREICEAGASWKWGSGYKPHVTLTYDLDDLDLREVEPYRGALLLGPEIFEEVNPEWRTMVQEVET